MPKWAPAYGDITTEVVDCGDAWTRLDGAQRVLAEAAMETREIVSIEA
jgi:hypothetical protein